MKKTIIMLLAVLLLLSGLSGCAERKRVTIEQTLENADMYFEELQKLAERYNAEIAKTTPDYVEEQDGYVEVTITISADEKVQIVIVNSAYDSQKGVEGFTVNYFLNNNNVQHQFDTQIFTDIVNCVSGKKISVEFCDEFLAAPESEYPAGKYGFDKLNGELVAKMHALNFLEDWMISYVMTKDGNEELSFGGLA